MMAKSRAPVLAWLIVGVLTTSVGAETWNERYGIRHPRGNLRFHSLWAADSGLRLQLRRTGADDVAEIRIGPAAGEVRLTGGGRAAAETVDAGQFIASAASATAGAAVEVVVQFRPESWAVHLDGQLALVCPPPFDPPARLYQPPAAIPSGDELGDVSFQKVAECVFRDNFLIPEGDDNPLAAWRIETGSWLMHSAQDIVAADPEANKRNKGKVLEPRYSSNFYSLKGSGRQAVITAGYHFHDNYSLQAAVQVQPGEQGLAFYYQDSTNFYTYTITRDVDANRPAELDLWHYSSRHPGQRRRLAAVTVDIATDQWVMPRVQVFKNRIRAYLDGTVVMDVPEMMPIGGRFGLFVDKATGFARFDDVSAESNHDLNLSRLEHLRFYTLAQSGQWFPDRKAAGLEAGDDAGPVAVLAPPTAPADQWLAIGAASHASHVFSAAFEPGEGDSAIGLLVGFTAADQPYYRYRADRRDGRDSVALERVSNDVATVVESLALPADAARNGPIVLMADGTVDGELRLYRDGELALIHHPADPVVGGSGLFVGAGARARVSDFRYQFARDELHHTREEKNQLFLVDPFMRHWSSPEGEWLTDTNGLTWNKSDFFKRFSITLPVVYPGELHLAVPEGGDNGAVVLRLADSNLVASVPGVDSAPVTVAITSSAAAVTVHYEGYWLWATAGEQVLLKSALPAPLTGRRVRVAGFTTEQLAKSRVVRYNVTDHLFAEAPHDWLINGGRWEVVNRFQCDPRWSQFNGQSEDNLAAMWTKRRYSGDFCMEAYVGVRHGWYDRAGDLNITVMNGATTPGSGYTVTCAGWDADYTRRYTTLYREGEMIDRSERKLLPEFHTREDRFWRNPLVGGGRPVHGAWYYVKVRRVGSRVEYYFDNLRVLTLDDAEPLQDGAVGIWTFMSSIMVARAKFGAEEMRPMPVPFTPVADAAGLHALTPLATDAPPATNDVAAAAADEPSAAIATGFAGATIDRFDPARWLAVDTVGRARLNWHRDKDQEPYFTLVNTLGSGGMHAAHDGPLTPYAELAGWRFYVKRTATARLNFHYSIGRLNSKGEYQPTQKYVHRLNGHDFSRGDYRMYGATAVPASAGGADGWHAGGEWTRVDAWLPAFDLEGDLDRTNRLVRLEGFGNLQPSPILYGLADNGPGAGYAVRGLCEIRYSPPGPRRATVPPDPPVADRGVAACEWIDVPDTVSVACAWSAGAANALVLSVDSAYPDRRLARATATVDGHAIELDEIGLNRLQGYLPRDPELAASTNPVVAVELTVAGQAQRRELVRAENPLQEPPVLMGLAEPSAALLNFESRTMSAPRVVVDPKRMTLRHADREQGTYLETANRANGQRLQTQFKLPVSMAEFPLLQFRYRAPWMAKISLVVNTAHKIQLSEPTKVVTPLAGATPFVNDDQWRTWRGRLVDAVGDHDLRTHWLRADSLKFASVDSRDMTGPVTRWRVDDLVLGPAVSTAEQLKTTPSYFSFAGIRAVFMALREGEEGYGELTEADRAALTWREVPNNESTVPDLEGIGQGPAHLFLRAVDADGRESRVTDVPFLHDTEPLTVTHAFDATLTDPVGNGTTLVLEFGVNGGAPVALDKLTYALNGRVVGSQPLLSQFSHTPDVDRIVLNWPFIFRKPLERLESGETAAITIGGIRDGAGNASPDVVVPLDAVHAEDRLGPTILALAFPTNVFYAPSWYGRAGGKPNLSVANGDAAVMRQWGQEPFLRMTVTKADFSAAKSFAGQPWSIKNFRHLSMRMRRPHYAAAEKSVVTAVLTLTTGEKHALVLRDRNRDDEAMLNLEAPEVIDPVPPAEPGDAVARPEDGFSVAWKSNEWHDLTLDVYDLLRPKLAPEILNKAEAKALHIQFTDAKVGEVLDLQAAYIHGPWPEELAITVDAYDGSGVGGLTWKWGEQTSEEKVLPLAKARVAGEDSWLRLHSRDKRGNLSLPVRLPIPGGASG